MIQCTFHIYHLQWCSLSTVIKSLAHMYMYVKSPKATLEIYISTLDARNGAHGEIHSHFYSLVLGSYSEVYR